MELEHKRSILKCFVSIIDLRFPFSFFFFGIFVLLFGPHVPMSHFLIIMNDSVSCRFQRIRNFHKISSLCGTMMRANDMPYLKNVLVR